MAGVLGALGLEVAADQRTATIEVVGCAGTVPGTDATLDTRQSGTTSRFLLAMLALGEGAYEVTAHPQMQARPMGTTFEALESLGSRVEPLG
jgi:3-phosphoshikimate 1-carboxyvinyltransferase